MSLKPGARPIPLAAPNISEHEIRLVLQTLESGRLSIGPMVEEFERRLAEMTNRPFAVACSSGTAGLHLAVRALGIREGDEVITTPFSFVASANCLLYERARPVFVDIEEQTLGLDPALVESALSKRTRGILPVHVFGKPCRIKDIVSIASEKGWSVIEDACEALGSEVAGWPAGAFGHASVFAFYPNKQITTGEGGMVVTADEQLANSIRSMRNQGRDADGTWLNHVQLGFNYRMDELSAALGVAQLDRRVELARARAAAAGWYADRLAQQSWLTLPQADSDTVVDWFVYVVRLAPEIDRTAVIHALGALGIQARPYFTPIHLQPFYRTEFGYAPGDFPVAERIAASTLALPFGSALSEAEVDRVCDRLISVVAGLDGESSL